MESIPVKIFSDTFSSRSHSTNKVPLPDVTHVVRLISPLFYVGPRGESGDAVTDSHLNIKYTQRNIHE